MAKELKGSIECIGENTEKYIPFSITINKKFKNGKPIIYRLKSIDSYRFMNKPLATLSDDLSEINNKKCRKCSERYDKSSPCTFINLKNGRLQYKCLECGDLSYKPIDLVKKFPNTNRFCNKNKKKLILLITKGVYPYEYMDSWERFNETCLPSKEYFYSGLNLEKITDDNYKHAQKVWRTFNMCNTKEYHNIYVQSDTVLLAKIFENFHKTCLRIYELDPAYFLSAPGLAWQACLKTTQVNLELLADYDMFLMIESGKRGGISQVTHHYAKANNKHMENVNTNVKSTFLEYLDANNLYGYAMCKKLPVSNFKWSNDLNKYTQEYIQNYNLNFDHGAILEVDIDYTKHLWGLHKDLSFLQKKSKTKWCKKTHRFN